MATMQNPMSSASERLLGRLKYVKPEHIRTEGMNRREAFNEGKRQFDVGLASQEKMSANEQALRKWLGERGFELDERKMNEFKRQFDESQQNAFIQSLIGGGFQMGSALLGGD